MAVLGTASLHGCSCDQAVDEGTSPSVRAKLAEQAALLFGAALRTLDSQELRDYVTELGWTPAAGLLIRNTPLRSSA